MFSIPTASTLNNVQITDRALLTNDQPNHSFHRMSEQLTRAENSVIKVAQKNLTDLPNEILEKIAENCLLPTLRNLKATNILMRKICEKPFAQQAKEILQNAVITLKENLAAGNANKVISILENLDALGLLTEKETAYLKINKVDLDCVVNGENLIQKIVKADRPNHLRLVIKAGATVNDNRIHPVAGQMIQPGTNLLEIAACHTKTGEVIKVLLKHGFSINAQNGHGNTALHVALSFTNLVAVETLLHCRADCNIPNNDGINALHSFVNRNLNRPNILIMMLEAGAKINIAGNGRTPLLTAVMQPSRGEGSLNLITILDYEDALNQSVETTLKAYEIAKKWNQIPTIKLLEERLVTSPYRNNLQAPNFLKEESNISPYGKKKAPICAVQ